MTFEKTTPIAPDATPLLAQVQSSFAQLQLAQNAYAQALATFDSSLRPRMEHLRSVLNDGPHCPPWALLINLDDLPSASQSATLRSLSTTAETISLLYNEHFHNEINHLYVCIPSWLLQPDWLEILHRHLCTELLC